MATRKEPTRSRTRRASSRSSGKPRCGLCGKTRKLTRAPCCASWICDDEHKYIPFSYARNSCSRNHRRYTLCGFHALEEHAGDWRTCKRCRRSFDTEDFVWYGTNEYNFVKLQDPPTFEPTRCEACDKVIRRGEGAYSQLGDQYWCLRCARKRRP